MTLGGGGGGGGDCPGGGPGGAILGGGGGGGGRTALWEFTVGLFYGGRRILTQCLAQPNNSQ